MAQYLEFYNKLDVTGFVVAAENYKKWWHNENIDAFKQGMCIFITNLLVLYCCLMRKKYKNLQLFSFLLPISINFWLKMLNFDIKEAKIGVGVWV